MPFLIQATHSISPSIASTLSPIINTPIHAVTSSIEMPVTTASSITEAQFESVRTTAGFLSFLRKQGFTDAEERGQAFYSQKQTTRSQRRAKRPTAVTQSKQERETQYHSNKANESDNEHLQMQKSTMNPNVNCDLTLRNKADSLRCIYSTYDTSLSSLPTDDVAQIKKGFVDWKRCDTNLKTKQAEIQELENRKAQLIGDFKKEKQDKKQEFNKHRGDVFCAIKNGKVKYINKEMAHPGQLISSEQAIEGCEVILESNDYAECENLQKIHCHNWLKAVETDRNLTACYSIKTFYNQTNLFNEQEKRALLCEKPREEHKGQIHPDSLLCTGAAIGAGAVLSSILMSLQRRNQNQLTLEQALIEGENIPLVTFNAAFDSTSNSVDESFNESFEIQPDEETALASPTVQATEQMPSTENQAEAAFSIEEATVEMTDAIAEAMEEALTSRSTDKKKKKDKKFAPSLRYADPPAYSNGGFSTIRVDAISHGNDLQRYKRLEAKLLESRYTEMLIQQKLQEAKQNPNSNIAELQEELNSICKTIETYKDEIRRMQLIFQVDENMEEMMAINRAICNGSDKIETISFLNEPPPSYAKTNMTGYTFQTFHEFCQAKRILTADIEYWKDVAKLNDLENKSNELILDALKLFEPSDEEAIDETNFTPIKLKDNFLSYLQDKVNVFEKTILTSMVKKQIKSIMQRFLNAIVEKMAEKLIESHQLDLSKYIEEFFDIINSRLKIKANNNILSCIERKLQDVEREMICSGVEQSNEESCEQFCNELVIEISNEYINSIFSTLKDDIVGKGNENADSQESELNAEIKKFIEEITSKLSEQVALGVDEKVHHQKESKEIIEKLESNISFLTQYQKQIHFSHQLINDLLSPIELADNTESFSSNISFQPEDVVTSTNVSLLSDEQI